MARSSLALTIGIVALSAMPALAEETRTSRPLRQASNDTLVKDCARFNGRNGYYANPWCSPAEQERWDKWEARKR